MTAHREKPCITSERIAWFAAYLRLTITWGVFHVSLDDGNYHLGAWDYAREPDDVREAAEWFDSLTPSQRKRLGRKAEAASREADLIERGVDMADMNNGLRPSRSFVRMVVDDRVRPHLRVESMYLVVANEPAAPVTRTPVTREQWDAEGAAFLRNTERSE